ncbi:MAG: TetR/AcrR family transcriptional regulator [Actinomycetota bacterium]|nr:TetR/AcrR family transcriptional regulator [Actinomycetota bacterium]
MKRAADDTKDQLFEAATQLFRELGYEATSHADISAEADIGRTTFYEHFASKEDLLVQLVQRDLPVLIDDLLSEIDSDISPDLRLRELTVRFVEFVGIDHLGLILHTEVPRLSIDAQLAIADSHRALSNEVMDIYRSGVMEGVFAELPGPLVGRLIQDAMMAGGRVVMNLSDPKQQVHEIAESTAAFLVNGLRK